MKMIRSNIKISTNFILISLVFGVIVFSSCSTGYFTQPKAEQKEVKEKPKTAPQPVVVDGIRTSYADLVEKTSPAVVQISVVKNEKSKKKNSNLEDFFKNSPFQMPRQQRQRPVQGFGSGVIVNKDGTILTNHHVIEDSEKITVKMNDNNTFEAKVVGSDPPSDLAVIKIEGEDLPFLELGDSDEVRIGDIVLAIGNPLGIGQSVTSGIISAKGRRTGMSDGSFEDFLQTDAPINRGNSGGALINLKGELIGINSQILSTSGGSIGIGFSIPSNMAKSVMEQLIENGKVRRGMLGVTIQDITSDVAKSLDLEDTKGVLVNNVMKGGAADKAGIKRGDILTAINGEEVPDGNSLRNKVASTKPGTEIKLTYLRDGKKDEINIKLGEFNRTGDAPASTEEKNDEKESSESGKLGLSLQKLTPEIAKQLNIPSEVKGLVVTAVAPDGAAAEKGIMRGDVILEINRQMVESLNDVESAIEKSGDKPILLLISRRGQTSFIPVQPK